MKIALLLLSLLSLGIVVGFLVLFNQPIRENPLYVLPFAGMWLGAVCVIFHRIVLAPGMIGNAIPKYLEWGIWYITNHKAKPGTPPNVMQRRYEWLMWLTKPYRECPTCMAGQAGFVAGVLTCWPEAWSVGIGLMFLGELALLIHVAIAFAFLYDFLWSKME